MTKRILIRLTLTIALVGPAACGNEEPRTRGAPTPASPAARAPEKHAPDGVTPGSHEDWCEEHQVPESMCTRCNPSLIPAFKATGDWCEEHGLPESQCRACNPDLRIERPAKTGG